MLWIPTSIICDLCRCSVKIIVVLSNTFEWEQMAKAMYNHPKFHHLHYHKVSNLKRLLLRSEGSDLRIS